MDAYERALRRLVQPGDIVLDLGAGTGILAMLAARRGAARVHALESMPIAGLAAELVAHNRLQGRVIVHQADALDLPPVEPVDLIVSDFMGRFVVDDGMLRAMHAAGAWLRPGGRCCPSHVRLLVAPVGDLTLGAITLFEDPFYGLDLSPAAVYARNYCYHIQLPPSALLGAAATYADLTPPAVGDAVFDAQLELPIARAGGLRALAGWFEASLAPDVVLSTAPGVETHWGQYAFPLPDVAVQAGDVVRARLWLDGGRTGEAWRWEGAIMRGDVVLEEFALEGAQRLGERDAASR